MREKSDSYKHFLLASHDLVYPATGATTGLRAVSRRIPQDIFAVFCKGNAMRIFVSARVIGDLTLSVSCRRGRVLRDADLRGEGGGRVGRLIRRASVIRPIAARAVRPFSIAFNPSRAIGWPGFRAAVSGMLSFRARRVFSGRFQQARKSLLVAGNRESAKFSGYCAFNNDNAHYVRLAEQTRGS